MLRNVALAFTALGLAAQATPGDAAKVRIHVDVGQHRGYRDARLGPWEVGYERGFDGGLRQGHRDARRHRYSDPWRHSRFRDGTSGHHSRHGWRTPSTDGYRTGYERTYRTAYRDHRDADRRHRRRAIRRYDYGHRHDGRFDLRYRRH